jgi:hypothetical protein
MRLATAADEILPLKDLIQAIRHLILILLSRVITRLGSLGQINLSDRGA